MDTIIVRGGNNQLKGTVTIEGAKNAALPILAASILPTSGKSKLTNVPKLSDVYTMKEVLMHLNVEAIFDESANEMILDATRSLNSITPFEYMSKMRASIVVMGPLLAREGHAKVALPGGCAIGTRPIDLHLKGFRAMGAQIIVDNGYVEATVDGKLKGATIYMDFPSVGATQNIMMAATRAEGTTLIENAAREPEIVDLANCLNKMGAKIVGAGTETIRIEGVDHLQAVEHAIIQDRIESGTFMVAAAVTAGDVLIRDCIVDHNRPLISKLREMGVEFTEEADGLRVRGPKQLNATNAKTLPHPGFPTDLQAPMTIAQLSATGQSIMRETVFENRFMHMDELQKMNAQFQIEGQTLIISGGHTLKGAMVQSTDLRAASSLVIAGLVAQGTTQVTNLVHLDRGYYQFTEKLKTLGANVERVAERITTTSSPNTVQVS